MTLLQLDPNLTDDVPHQQERGSGAVLHEGDCGCGVFPVLCGHQTDPQLWELEEVGELPNTPIEAYEGVEGVHVCHMGDSYHPPQEGGQLVSVQ